MNGSTDGDTAAAVCELAEPCLLCFALADADAARGVERPERDWCWCVLITSVDMWPPSGTGERSRSYGSTVFRRWTADDWASKCVLYLELKSIAERHLRTKSSNWANTVRKRSKCSEVEQSTWHYLEYDQVRGRIHNSIRIPNKLTSYWHHIRYFLI